MTRYDDLPYRTCVGVMLLNKAGLVFIGRRAGGVEHVDESHVWQMPQGGVDPGEDTWEAAKRELYEETSVRSVEKLGEVPFIGPERPQVPFQAVRQVHAEPVARLGGHAPDRRPWPAPCPRVGTEQQPGRTP